MNVIVHAKAKAKVCRTSVGGERDVGKTVGHSSTDDIPLNKSTTVRCSGTTSNAAF